ncbi:hypothetical protein [Streptomyces canus]|uniref:hypothetical protein n=1 Tax=Streptomyces canus TaxID=58343 RepID=UPI002E2E3679|nr:hypothetical protein [Streptomyces canus]
MHRDPGQPRFFGDLTPDYVGENVRGFFTNSPRMCIGSASHPPTTTCSGNA